jgi:hypothetical protein
MTFDVDQLDITTRLVFGTSTPGSDPNTHIRPDATTSQPPSLSLKMSDYLTEGAGRYALPSRAPIVSAFFSDVTSRNLADGTYTLAQLRTALSLGVGGDGSTQFSVSQYITGTTSSDFMERAYIFGSTGFELKDNMRFVVNGVNYTIENLEVIALQDNFDFQSSNPIAIAGNVLLKSAFDPYGLIPEVGGVTVPVDILYTGAGKIYASYGLGSYLLDQASDLANTVTAPVALARFQVEVAGLVTNTGYLGTMNGTNRFSYKTADGKKIIYGSPNDDTINVLSAEVTADIYFSYQMVGGTGNDTITGGVFDDEIWGGEGNDLINGGLGDDKSTYRGNFSEYDIEFLNDNSVHIIDSNNSRDGTDTLSAIEKAVFKDATVNLKPALDLAFVIDTTGSMSDDIDAVQRSANNIIDAIFDANKGLLNSRIAVVGYNDPYTETFLSFTDQAKISDRKTAARNGINDLYADGGGDYPESVNAGLIHALSGRAGKWRKEAAARRIILFGDAPPNDPELRAEVLRLAANIELDTITTVSLTPELLLTSFSVTEADALGKTVTYPIEIYTIFIGDDDDVKNDFESLSSTTGGKLFSATDESKVVMALLAAIATPINTPPIAKDDVITTSQATAVRVPVLTNDSDPEGNPLKIIDFDSSTAKGGSLSLFDNDTPEDFTDDQLIFIPDPEFTGSDSFGYTISDGKMTSAASVVVNVEASTVKGPSSPKPTYTLSSSATEVFEGDRLSVRVASTDVTIGAPLYWSFSGEGITSSDFTDGITTDIGAIGADGNYDFSTLIAIDSVSDPDELLQIEFFSDADRTTQVGNTLTVMVKELTADQSKAAQIQALYLAYFGRPADPEGLAYWTTQNADYPQAQLSDAFAQSPEYIASITGKSVSQIVADYYQRLFNRAPEVAGLTYWLNQINTGALTTQSVGLALVTSAQTQTGTADSIAVASKLTGADQFTKEVAKSNAGILAYGGVNGLAAGVIFLAPIQTATTIPTALQTTAIVNSLIATKGNLNGSAGAELIIGSEANDTIHGGAGADTITGGNGRDTFIYDNLGPAYVLANADTITDFNQGTGINSDVLRLSASAFSGLTAGSSFNFTNIAEATNQSTNVLVDTKAAILGATSINALTNTRLAYATDTQQWLYDSNGDWASGAVNFANTGTVLTATGLTTSNIQVF